MWEPERHVPLRADPWDAAQVRTAIQEIVDDALAAFDPERLWMAHPQDQVPERAPRLYDGAAGVIWALDHLRRVGAARVDRDLAATLGVVAAAQREVSASHGDLAPYASWLMSEVAVDALHMRLAPSPDVAERVYARLRGALGLPVQELMWGTAGGMFAARFMAEMTGEPRWRALYLDQATRLIGELRASEVGPAWMQQLYGNPPTVLYGVVHGLAGNLWSLFHGWDWLEPAAHERARDATQTLIGAAHEDDEGVNWPVGSAQWPAERGAIGAALLQICHGGTGIVTAIADMPFELPELERMLLRAGELIWRAGPLAKGANICHGTAGSGYACLKLHARTGDAGWLARARSLAMTAIAQVDEDRAHYSQGRYTLWTGDLGTAIYLADCLTGAPRFPTIDVF